MDGQVGQWQVPLSLEKGMSHFPNGQSMAMLDMCEGREGGEEEGERKGGEEEGERKGGREGGRCTSLMVESMITCSCIYMCILMD